MNSIKVSSKFLLTRGWMDKNAHLVEEHPELCEHEVFLLLAENNTSVRIEHLKTKKAILIHDRGLLDSNSTILLLDSLCNIDYTGTWVHTCFSSKAVNGYLVLNNYCQETKKDLWILANPDRCIMIRYDSKEELLESSDIGKTILSIYIGA